MSNTQISFSVSNMKCGGCVSAVESALKEVSGIEDIKVGLEEPQVTVSSSMPAADIAKIISDAGYPATPTT